ncbi:enoyl-CoA hydratase/isomerase family protein [Terricaulis sp.]|uniref:enoyl-CoA hydratase/isomerase family protein n=1 Tax=Terricaulis sp. TaxID=2768686 RepID=UPI003783531C
MSDSVRLEIDGAIATVAINRPEARNTLRRGTGAEVYRAVKDVADNQDIRVLIFRGVGDDFCCGADMKTPEDRDGPKPTPSYVTYQVAVLLHEMPQVTVSAIRGGCAGAGFGWACASDFRVGDDSVVMNTAFLDVGVAGDMGVPWTLPRLIGASRARDLTFFPRKVRSEEAKSLGLLDRLWPAAAFEAELTRFAATLAAAAPLAVAALKSNFVQSEQIDFRSFISLEAERHIRLLGTDDRYEAFRAWLEKRPPKFSGH